MENLRPYLLQGSRIWQIDNKKERVLINIFNFVFIGGLLLSLVFVNSNYMIFIFAILFLFLLLFVVVIIQAQYVTPKTYVYIEENGHLFFLQKSTGSGAMTGGIVGGAIGAAIGGAIDAANAKKSVVTSPGVFGIAASGKAQAFQILGVKAVKEQANYYKINFSLVLLKQNGVFANPSKRRVNISKKYEGIDDLIILINNLPPVS